MAKLEITEPKRKPYKAKDPSKDETVAKGCKCTSICQGGRDPEFCANWLARTHKMELLKCNSSGNITWHRDGTCADCHPLFPVSLEFLPV